MSVSMGGSEATQPRLPRANASAHETHLRRRWREALGLFRDARAERGACGGRRRSRRLSWPRSGGGGAKR
eukprot:scaffold56773_cov66-Phaeocystis_antarctica.AAC.2